MACHFAFSAEGKLGDIPMANTKQSMQSLTVELTACDIDRVERWIAEHGGTLDHSSAVSQMIRAASDIVEIRQIDLSDGDAINRLINDRGA